MPKPKSPFIYYLRFEWSNVLPFNGLFNLFVFTFNQNLGGIRTLVLILIRNYVTIIALQQRPRITYLVRNRLCWDKTFQEVFEVILGWILMTLRFLFKPSSFQSSLLPLRIQPLSLSLFLPQTLSFSLLHSRGFRKQTFCDSSSNDTSSRDTWLPRWLQTYSVLVAYCANWIV